MTQMCFFDPVNKRVWDYANPDAEGVYRSEYAGKTLAEYEFEGDNLILLDIDTAIERHRAKYMEPPKRIGEARFTYLLEVLPPCRWRRGNFAESFFVSERITMDLVTWAVRLGDPKGSPEYWELVESDRLTHEDIVRKVLACRETEEG